MVQALRPERLFIGVGLILLASYGLIRLHSTAASRLGLATAILSKATKLETSNEKQPTLEGRTSFALWSEKRIRAHKQSLAVHFDPPLGVLTIAKLELEAPVFNGTDDVTLDRGVGRIIGTGHADSSGNTGIAGHRDGFFRSLKDIQLGDQVELKTTDSVFAYRVKAIEVVKPDNVRVLEDTGQPSLTLVTCYPFYFVGSAPERYIVHCSLMGMKPAIDHTEAALHN